MIIFDLSCADEHRFEGWFQNNDDMQKQLADGLLRCPVCDNPEIRKVPAMAKINTSSGRDEVRDAPSAVAAAGPSRDTHASTSYAASQEFVRMLHNYVDSNFIDVGNRFAEEARKIHSGDREDVGIRGTASREQVRELKEEGISTLPLPARPVDKNRLN